MWVQVPPWVLSDHYRIVSALIGSFTAHSAHLLLMNDSFTAHFEPILSSNSTLNELQNYLCSMAAIFDIINEEIHSFADEHKFGYHVTRRKNLSSIQKVGILPRVPEDFGPDGDLEGVYLFKIYDDMETALWNWMGERIEEWEEENGEEYDEIVLKIDMSKLNPQSVIDTAGFEWTVTKPIPPEAIVEILNI